MLSPEEDKLIEQRLGIVTHLKEVQNLATIVNQKVDKEEFVTDLFFDSVAKRSQRSTKLDQATP